MLGRPLALILTTRTHYTGSVINPTLVEENDPRRCSRWFSEKFSFLRFLLLTMSLEIGRATRYLKHVPVTPVSVPQLVGPV